jgi:predicted 3-demethylubiquinone-9 3-methyltransferase (glyoxalase superfamily)
MKKITPFLWFDGKAEEAMRFYTSIFPNSRTTNSMRTAPDGPLLSVSFELEGQEFIALNGGPSFGFTPAVSFFIACKTQQEVDEYWEKLSAGGAKNRCGWLTDKYGLSWQVVPEVLGEMLQDRDQKRARRVMDAMLQMGKLDIARLRQAYEAQAA